MTIEEYVSIAGRWGKQRNPGVAVGGWRPYDIDMTQWIDSLDARLLRRAAALAVISAACAVLSTAPAFSTPMRCSGEEKICIAACKKSLNRSSISTCLTNCGLRQSACMKSGCWDSGPQRYCGLLKQ
jgi:hypothetical protein